MKGKKPKKWFIVEQVPTQTQERYADIEYAENCNGLKEAIMNMTFAERVLFMIKCANAHCERIKQHRRNMGIE